MVDNKVPPSSAIKAAEVTSKRKTSMFVTNMCFPLLLSSSRGEGRWPGSQLTSKQHPPREHLCQDAASGPHVNGFGVVVRGEEQAW